MLFIDATVNVAPSFAKGADPILVAQNSRGQVIPAWATAISAGPANEASQVVSFIVSNSLPALFSAPPSLDANGTLTFTPIPNLRGTNFATLWLRDPGGTANGGQDISPAQTLTIIVGNSTDADSDGLPDDFPPKKPANANAALAGQPKMKLPN